MKIFNKILLVMVSAIAIYAGTLIVSDISSISEKISLLIIEFIPISLGLVTIGWGIMFLRWNLLLRNEKIFIPIKDSFLIYISGFALSIIPGKVGEFIKSYLLKVKFGIPETKTIPNDNFIKYAISTQQIKTKHNFNNNYSLESKASFEPITINGDCA